MLSNRFVRRIDDLGRITFPLANLHSINLHNGDPVEITLQKDGAIVIRKYKKSWEQCAIDFYDSHPHIFQNNTATYAFYHHGHYTVCFINSCCTTGSRIGTAKRCTKDNPDYRIGKVAAYARAIGQPIDELIGYKGK
jgi:bifunctional DNA-binding transcriptional regulator/antitoxin component of YhaV-PrlF toxin-antitoxin module